MTLATCRGRQCDLMIYRPLDSSPSLSFVASLDTCKILAKTLINCVTHTALLSTQINGGEGIKVLGENSRGGRLVWRHPSNRPSSHLNEGVEILQVA